MRKRARRLWYLIVGRTGANRVTRRLHVSLYRLSGGRWVLGRSLGNLTLLLTTTGARSGRSRTVPLWTYPDGDTFVLVASNGGRPHPPAWQFNLVAHPDVSVQRGRRVRAMRAREAQGTERERLWAMVTAAYPGYLAYQDWWGERLIPLMVLSES